MIHSETKQGKTRKANPNQPYHWRIRDSYCPGHGDGGYSNPCSMSKKISKGRVEEPAIAYHQAIVELRLATNQLIIVHDATWIPVRLEQEDVIAFVKLLRKATFSLGAYCFMFGSDEEGNETRSHRFCDSTEYYVLKQTEIWHPQYAGAKEFQYFPHPNTHLLDCINSAVRTTESVYTDWRHHPTTLAFVAQNPQADEWYARHGRILNRLSSYFWCAIKREEFKLGLDPSYWEKQMPECELEVLPD